MGHLLLRRVSVQVAGQKGGQSHGVNGVFVDESTGKIGLWFLRLESGCQIAQLARPVLRLLPGVGSVLAAVSCARAFMMGLLPELPSPCLPRLYRLHQPGARRGACRPGNPENASAGRAAFFA